MKPALLLIAGWLIGGVTGAVQAQQPYWICVDEGGARAVQDQPCADAPDAPPSGIGTSPMTVPALAAEADVDTADTRPREDGIDSLGYWKRRAQRVGSVIGDVERWRIWLAQRWVWMAAGVLLGLLLIRALWRRAWPAWQQRRIERAALGRPDPYRRVLRERVRSAQTLVQEPSMQARAPRPQQWSMQVIRALDNAQFESLCRQLWRWRGLRVELDQRTDSAVCLTLRRGVQADRLHGLVWCHLGAESTLGAAPVRELFGLMHHLGSPHGAIATRGDFDAQARDFARGKAIEFKGALTLVTEIEALTEGQRSNLLDAVFGEEAVAAV